MKCTRRRLGRIVLGFAAAGTFNWSGIGVARAGPALPTIDLSRFPALTRLASLYPDDAACQRIASTLSPSALVELSGSGITRAERNAARAFAERQSAIRPILQALLADDFRSGRTVQASGFHLSETETALALVRSATARL